MEAPMKAFLAALALTFFTSFALAAGIPPAAEGAKAALDKSPRHGEWVDIKVEGMNTPLKCFVVYPEVKDKAGVVLVIHEIYGMSDWVRSVADQLAADGFIAIAPDFLSGRGPNGGGTESLGQNVGQEIRKLTDEDTNKALAAVQEYGKKLPASNGKTATIGFCWGGGKSFSYAVFQPSLDAAVVYYGQNPSAEYAARVRCPVLGCYGGNDARVNMTIEPAKKVLGDKYTPNLYEGAGHAFLRLQATSPANAKAAEQAWPTTIKFLQEHLK
jgi:carboxymethylenebutenolidase